MVEGMFMPEGEGYRDTWFWGTYLTGSDPIMETGQWYQEGWEEHWDPEGENFAVEEWYREGPFVAGITTSAADMAGRT